MKHTLGDGGNTSSTADVHGMALRRGVPDILLSKLIDDVTDVGHSAMQRSSILPSVQSNQFTSE
jgi:hypothetical protein